ncbi:MAG: hypothetical protein F4Y03_05490 [Alphaproteobacteria bacterium]|nr:hypothetical protein [Alphaproteobacteria bacterium]
MAPEQKGTPVKVNVQGQELDGVLVDIVEARDQVHELHLADGAILQVRLVATGVVRVDDVKDSLGFPQYVLQSTNVMSVVKGPGPSRNKAH